MTITTLLLMASVDPRLGAMTKVYVQPVDDLQDDRPVAACVVQHLPTALPLTIVETPEEADVTLKIKARRQSSGFSAALSTMNGVRVSDVITSAWIDDKAVWEGHATVRLERIQRALARPASAEEDFCQLADASIDNIRVAMRKARGK